MNKVISKLIVASFMVVATSSAWACQPTHNGEPCAGSLGEADVNHDGVISQKEFIAFHSKRFKELDTNHDGKLTPQEVGAGEGMGGRLEAADANHDGALTREEAKGLPVIEEHFDEIDANKDGKVTPEELRSAMEKHRPEKMGGKGEKAPEKK